MTLNTLKEVFDFSIIDWKLWSILFLSFFLPFMQGLGLLPWLWGGAVFYFLVPLALVVLVFRESLKDYGLMCFKEKRRILVYAIVFSLFLTPIILFASFIPEVEMFYARNAINSMEAFLAFELEQGLHMFFWEFLFRGFILFGLFKRIGNAALPVHAIPFALFHMGKPSLEVVASFFAALLLGQIALKAKSFLPAFIIHWVIHAEMIFFSNLL